MGLNPKIKRQLVLLWDLFWKHKFDPTLLMCILEGHSGHKTIFVFVSVWFCLLSTLVNTENCSSLNPTAKKYRKLTSTHTSTTYGIPQFTLWVTSHTYPHLVLQLSIWFQVILLTSRKQLFWCPYPQKNFGSFSRKCHICCSICGFTSALSLCTCHQQSLWVLCS